jgi:hypothetical protein
MKRFQRTIHPAAVVVFALLSLVTVAAGDDYVEHKEPSFPEVEPGHALVYFARPDFMRLLRNSTFKVFVDATPAGWLPQRSYLTAQVDPGSRLVWGLSNDGQRFTFEAGKTYLLVLSERYGSHRELIEASWASGDPADVRPLVSEKKLSYVTPMEGALAKLRDEGAKKFAKAAAQSPEAVAAGLPARFETVWYRPGKRGFSLKAYDATGTLTIDTEAIEFKSDKKTLTIRVSDIQSVSLDKVTSAANFADPNRWGIVKFGAEGEVAAFHDGHGLGGGGDTERIYLTMRSVLDTRLATAK